jgi:hypothetical protein
MLVGVHLGDVAMPSAVALRPRDPRGVPIPAITRWESGLPVFREASGERQLLCALQNRAPRAACRWMTAMVCGTSLMSQREVDLLRARARR